MSLLPHGGAFDNQSLLPTKKEKKKEKKAVIDASGAERAAYLVGSGLEPQCIYIFVKERVCIYVCACESVYV